MTGVQTCALPICTSQSLFQQSMELPDLILDMNKVFTEDDPDDSELTFLTKLH